jgi:hypothetical protein
MLAKIHATSGYSVTRGPEKLGTVGEVAGEYE